MTINEHEGKPAEIFITCAKEGSLVSGMLDSLAIAISIGLRAGVDPKKYIKSLTGVRFDPQGYARLGEENGVEVTSIVDAIMKILVRLYPELSPEEA